MQAWNVDTGKHVWTTTFAKSANWGPMLATAGGLVFAGGTNDRMFRAFDAKSGKMLWESPTTSGIIGVPISFSIDGQHTSPSSPDGDRLTRDASRLNRYPGDILMCRKVELSRSSRSSNSCHRPCCEP